MNEDQSRQSILMRHAQALGEKDDRAGEKMKGIADKTFVIVLMFSVIIGFWVLDRIGGISGITAAILIISFGTFIAYVLLNVLRSYGDIINNAIEQTQILLRMETEKKREMLLREQETANTQQAAQTTQAPPGDQTAIRTEEAALDDTGADKTAVPDKPPVLGVPDSRLRRVVHFAERHSSGVICPVCGHVQDSDNNNCSSCHSKFIYDNEAPDAGGEFSRQRP